MRGRRWSWATLCGGVALMVLVPLLTTCGIRDGIRDRWPGLWSQKRAAAPAVPCVVVTSGPICPHPEVQPKPSAPGPVIRDTVPSSPKVITTPPVAIPVQVPVAPKTVPAIVAPEPVRDLATAQAEAKAALAKAYDAFHVTKGAYDGALTAKAIGQVQYDPWRKFHDETYAKEMPSARAALDAAATVADVDAAAASIRALGRRLEEIKRDFDALPISPGKKSRLPIMFASADGAEAPENYKPLPDTRWSADDLGRIVNYMLAAITALVGTIVAGIVVIIQARTAARIAASSLTTEKGEPVKVEAKLEEIKGLMVSPPTLAEAYAKIERLEGLLGRLVPNNAEVKREAEKS